MSGKQFVFRVSDADKKTILLAWNFIPIAQKSKYTYGEVWLDFMNGVYPSVNSDSLTIMCKNHALVEVRATSSMSSFDEIVGNADTDLIDVVKNFEMKFFKFVVRHSADCEECQPPAPRRPVCAFQVMMSAAKDVAGQSLKPTEHPRTQREKLTNSILNFFSDRKCQFVGSSTDLATSFINKLGDLLWYLDGQYTKIEKELPLNLRFPKDIGKRFSGFNQPEIAKHRKRTLENLSEQKLSKLCIHVREVIQTQLYMDRMPWAPIKIDLLQMLEVVEAFILKRQTQNKRVLLSQSTVLSVESRLEKETKVKELPVKKGGRVHAWLVSLDDQLKLSDCYVPIQVRQYLQPGLDRKRVYDIIEMLRRDGLSSKCVLYTHHSGGNKPSYHFIWKLLPNETDGALLERCALLILKVKEEMPTYIRRITKREFAHAYGFVTNPVTLRNIFRELTGDQSAATSLTESQVDSRFQYAMLCEEPSILVDLRHQPAERKSDLFTVFFKEAAKYLAEDVGVACQERRHGEQLYLAKAISIRDLHDKIKERVPPGTAIPSTKWFRYQFQPLNPRANTAKYFKGNMTIKMMVQKRQVRVNHVDAHYCAAAWRYLREMAIEHRTMATLVSMDDKHKVKVGEPSYPLAAAERGKQVIVGPNQVMAVGDHDFSKCTVTPSVNLIINIPEDINCSFYRGDVFIGFEDSILEPSSALRHATELQDILKSRGDIPPVVLLYTDGGPDHRCTYMSVKLANIALFLSLDLDVLVALRTAPSNSWANPVERIMSIVNTGLQGVGLMRRKMSENFEKAVAKASSVKEMRDKITEVELQNELKDSLSFPIDLLKSQMGRMKLKDRPFQTFSPASEEDIQVLWDKCLDIEHRLQRGMTSVKDVKNLDNLTKFLDHCCIQGHYCFQIKKCGEADCSTCRPLRDDRSKEVGTLPFPQPAGDEHYKPFREVYKTQTEENRPSKQTRPKAARKKIGFSPSVQHARNTNTMVQCTECNKWRLIFSKTKLNKRKVKQLEDALKDVDYTCGMMLDELHLPGLNVMVKDHDCGDHMEKLYYACKYEDACIYCGVYVDGADDNDSTYPQCDECNEVPIQKR